MRSTRWSMLGVLALTLSVAACERDFLTGGTLDNDPNRPTVATRNQRFVAVQSKMQVFHEGHLYRTAGMWIQHFAGTDRQYISLDKYDQTEGDFTNEMAAIYTGGGLIDMRVIRASAEADGDRKYAGIIKVWEAFTFGMAASAWGAIPYSEAAGDVTEPKLDTQLEVYTAVLALLDGAIADLQSNQGAGPGAVDIIYGGDATKWIQAAYTLKARFNMHLAELQGAPRYTAAIAAAEQGISTPANNFRTFHTAVAGEENIWFQYQVRQRDSYMRVGKNLVDLMKSRSDPRLTDYFARGNGDSIYGVRPGTADPGASNISDARLAPAFRQPLITYAENQLILAEAKFALGGAANEAAALVHLNNARQAAGLPAIVAAGALLRQEILTEKYIALYQNMEAWNDYKRTCFPVLTPAVAGANVPGRMLYGVGERNNNRNIPPPAEQPARNQNDPQPCP